MFLTGSEQQTRGGRVRISNLFVVVGPSGVGKTSLTEPILKDYAHLITRPLSYTSRDPRPGEADGHDYYFCSRPTVSVMWSQNLFIAQADVYGELYGTLTSDVRLPLSQGKKVLLIMNPEGCEQIKAAGFGPVVIGILPPSLDELQRRLTLRGATHLDARLVAAKEEIEYAKLSTYVITNDLLERATEELKYILNLGENK